MAKPQVRGLLKYSLFCQVFLLNLSIYNIHVFNDLGMLYCYDIIMSGFVLFVMVPFQNTRLN